MLNFKEIAASALIVYITLSLILRSRYPKTPIWALMAFASFMSVALRLIRVDDLGSAVNIEVILFLVGMFSIVALAESSGLLDAVSLWFVSRFKRRRTAIIGSAYLFGITAAFAVNDTVALMGPPIAYSIARALEIEPKIMFLLLAYSLTIGSVMTPIGNPQNMLIAVESGVKAPFIEFLKWLAVPTLINIYVTALYIVKAFKVEDKPVAMVAIPHERISNRWDAYLGGLGLVAVVGFLLINDVLQLYDMPHVKSIGFIPFVAAAALYIASSSSRRVLGGVDWGTIVFFITMFITMEAIWRAGVLQKIIGVLNVDPRTPPALNILLITFASIVFSQLLSNVPFTKFFVNYMKSVGFSGASSVEWVTLAMAATIAGNLTVLGAASNIIVIETLETKYNQTITFTEFLRHGVVITAINTAIYLGYMYLIIHVIG